MAYQSQLAYTDKTACIANINIKIMLLLDIVNKLSHWTSSIIIHILLVFNRNWKFFLFLSLVKMIMVSMVYMTAWMKFMRYFIKKMLIKLVQDMVDIRLRRRMEEDIHRHRHQVQVQVVRGLAMDTIQLNRHHLRVVQALAADMVDNNNLFL